MNTNDLSNTNLPKECIDLYEYILFIQSITDGKKYISKKDYTNIKLKYSKVIEHFNVLKNSGVLDVYCEKNNFPLKQVENVLEINDKLDFLIEYKNNQFLVNQKEELKDYLDNILKDVDPNILLDNNQRDVVLSDEDYTLVIAGAGAGKTTTVAAKAKYLVDKMGIDPNEILIVSFTNKAVDELRTRINKQLNLDCIISTFHSIGNAILRTKSNDKLNIVTEDKLYWIIQDYFSKTILNNETMVKKIVLFFASYLEPEKENIDELNRVNEILKTNYSTLKSDLGEIRQNIVDTRSKKKVTIQNEVLRSYQEVEIANFLYLNNIEYKYEPIYRYNIKLSNKPYTPDFIIKQGNKVAYIEHFGISEDGKNSLYDTDKLDKYKKAIIDKITIHKKHRTNLIYTFSSYMDKRSLLDDLKQKLEKNGFVLKRKNDREVLERIIKTEENRYVRKLVLLINRFINLFKTNGYSVDKFDDYIHETKNERNKLFLEICKDCYLTYERYLNENNAIDFQDMINNSAKVLRDMAKENKKLHFKYIIVDEYQDISKQRFDLVEELHKVCDAKIVAVGDDWQSIYAFSGSDIQLFLDFEKKMGYAKLLKIENTYRNSQEVIDIAGNFIQKNIAQIRKTLKSPKHIDNPVIIYTYDASLKKKDGPRESGSNYNTALAVENAIDDIVERAKKENKKVGNILIIGRFGFDGYKLQNSELFEWKKRGSKVVSFKYPDLKITFMTAHASKGLGFDNVIIINGINGTYGFPSKIQDDPVLNYVKRDDRTIDFAEERRLFYVALTRTKNRVYCIAPSQNPSPFLTEIKNDYNKVSLIGEWNEENVRESYKKCPICSYPLQFRYKEAYGLRLHMCTNEPEVCDFMTNEIRGEKLQIMKCDHCQDGYLIVRRGRENEYFLGCTNYNTDGTGCNNTISKKDYYKMMRFSE